MKSLLYLSLTMLWLSLIPLEAQVSYHISYHPNVGNPGLLNQEDDFNAIDWNVITPGGLSSNQWSAPVSLPFPFSFFGQDFYSCRVSANGLLTFGAGNGGLYQDNTPLPQASLPPHTIACFWEAFTIFPPTSTNDFILAKTFGTAPNRQFWLRWYSFEWGSANFAYLAVVLEEGTGEFYLVDQYSSAALSTMSTTVGAQQHSSFAAQIGQGDVTLSTTGSAHYDNSYYHFVPYPIPPEDLAVVGLPNLPAEACSDGPEPLTMQIVNQGQLPSYGWTIGYAVNGGTPVLESVSQTILPGDTLLKTFGYWPDLSHGGTFTLKTWVASAADPNAANDTLSRVVSRSRLVSQFPYVEGFEADPGGWQVVGQGNPWEWGTPVGTTIQGAATGVKAWATNLSGPYAPLARGEIISPCLDLSQVGSQTHLGMSVWWDSEAPWDGAAVQASIDGGQTWQVVGQVGTDWYNSQQIGSQPGSQPFGWTGSQSQGSNGWRQVQTPLPAHVIGEPSVRLRVAFAANAAVQKDGFAFDQVLIGTPPSVNLGTDGYRCPGSLVSAGTGHAAYRWSTGDTTAQILLQNPGPTPIVDSQLVVTVYNQTGLFDRDTLTFSMAAPMQVREGINIPVSCHDATDGQLGLNIEGGTGPFTVLWSHGVSGMTLENVSPGWYGATVQDLHGCQQGIDSLHITAPAPLAITETLDHLACYGDSSGSITLTAAGGNQGYAWNWDHGGHEATQTDLAAGAYTVTLTDSLGCALTQSFQLSQPDSIQVTLTQVMASSCPDQQDGSLTLVASGGTAPYAYDWAHGAQGPSISNLAVGTYTLTITDTNGCLLESGPFVVAYQDSAPTAGFDYLLEKDVLTTLDSSQGASAFLWLFGDGEQATIQEPQYQYGDTGQFILTQIVSNTCGQDTAQTLIWVEELDTTIVITPPDDTTTTDTGTVGIWQPTELQEPALYPNPNAGQFVLCLPVDEDPWKVELFDIQGRKLWCQTCQSGVYEQEIQLDQNIPAGFYQLFIRNSDHTYAKPLWLRY